MMPLSLPRWLRAEAGPLLALVMVLLGALVALGQYQQLRLDRQSAETARYLAEFDHGPVAAAWRCLSASWEAESRPGEALHVAAPADPLPDGLQAHRHFMLDMVDADRLQAITTVFRYYLRLALCIRMGGCDQAIAVDHLGELAWRFRTRHYHVLTEHLAAHEVDQVFEILAPRPRGSGKGQAARPRGGDDVDRRQSAPTP